MVLNIGKRIAEFRKAKAASQEQLADFVGVSVAAVSKWETGSSYPDITLLPAIAEFFGVSIDALMDYSVTADEYEEIRRKANAYDEAGDFGAGIGFIEKALKKYPNDFNMTLSLAGLKYAKGTSSSGVWES
jgi:transcriptional regulator with XRE-family HTH domain